jgi:hypothetical protein
MKYIITESQKNRLSELLTDKLKKDGVIETAKSIGLRSIHDLSQILKDYVITPDDKAVSIIEFIRKRGEGLSISELTDEIILSKTEGREIHVVEYLGYNGVFINVIDDDTDVDRDEYSEPYVNLPNRVLDEIIDLLIKFYEPS